jgi:hypothetical protein
MKKFGFEFEEFITNRDGELQLVPEGFPADSCGWLLEHRGEPHNDPFQAVGSVIAAREATRRHLKKKHPDLFPQGALLPFTKVPRELKLQARRKFEKGLLKYENLYGKKPTTRDTAGLHVSITEENTIYVPDKKLARYNSMWDFPSFIRACDLRYKNDIKATKRVPGFYELKNDGRFEYRSLPITIDLYAFAAFLLTFFFGDRRY